MPGSSSAFTTNTFLRSLSTSSLSHSADNSTMFYPDNISIPSSTSTTYSNLPQSASMHSFSPSAYLSTASGASSPSALVSPAMSAGILGFDTSPWSTQQQQSNTNVPPGVFAFREASKSAVDLPQTAHMSRIKNRASSTSLSYNPNPNPPSQLIRVPTLAARPMPRRAEHPAKRRRSQPESEIMQHQVGLGVMGMHPGDGAMDLDQGLGDGSGSDANQSTGGFSRETRSVTPPPVVPPIPMEYQRFTGPGSQTAPLFHVRPPFASHGAKFAEIMFAAVQSSADCQMALASLMGELSLTSDDSVMLKVDMGHWFDRKMLERGMSHVALTDVSISTPPAPPLSVLHYLYFSTTSTSTPARILFPPLEYFSSNQLPLPHFDSFLVTPLHLLSLPVGMVPLVILAGDPADVQTASSASMSAGSSFSTSEASGPTALLASTSPGAPHGQHFPHPGPASATSTTTTGMPSQSPLQQQQQQQQAQQYVSPPDPSGSTTHGRTRSVSSASMRQRGLHIHSDTAAPYDALQIVPSPAPAPGLRQSESDASDMSSTLQTPSTGQSTFPHADLMQIAAAAGAGVDWRPSTEPTQKVYSTMPFSHGGLDSPMVMTTNPNATPNSSSANPGQMGPPSFDYTVDAQGNYVMPFTPHQPRRPGTGGMMNVNVPHTAPQMIMAQAVPYSPSPSLMAGREMYYPHPQAQVSLPYQSAFDTSTMGMGMGVGAGMGMGMGMGMQYSPVTVQSTTTGLWAMPPQTQTPSRRGQKARMAVPTPSDFLYASADQQQQHQLYQAQVPVGVGFSQGQGQGQGQAQAQAPTAFVSGSVPGQGQGQGQGPSPSPNSNET